MPGVRFRLVSDMAQHFGPDFGPVIEESGVEPKVEQLYGTPQSGSGGKAANKQQSQESCREPASQANVRQLA